MKLTVVLGASGEASFDITLDDNAFVRKWTKELQWCLDNCAFVQHEAFAGFLPLNKRVQLLKNSIVTINQYVKNFIELRDDIINQDQNYFNYLHSQFERLSGKFDSPTRLMLVANAELKSAIRNLNYMIHMVEDAASINKFLHVSFDKDSIRRHPLDIDDYQHAEFVLPAGSLCVHYIELGKDFHDLYQDNLPLNYPAFENLHYYSGEAILHLEDYDYFSEVGFQKWFEKNNIDPYDKTLGHGQLCLGRTVDVEDARAKLIKHQFINNIVINE